MDDRSMGTGINLAAIGHGLLWGAAVMLLGAAVLGLWMSANPLTPALETALPYVLQGVGCLLAGVISGQRAGGSGLMHGGLAGAGLVLAVSVLNGIGTDIPHFAVLAKNGAVAVASGALGGIVGVNVRS